MYGGTKRETGKGNGVQICAPVEAKTGLGCMGGCYFTVSEYMLDKQKNYVLVARMYM